MVLHVLNLHDGASLDYSLAFIKALIIPPCSCTSVSAANLSSGASQLWPANGPVLKCFVPLQTGGNRVRLSCCHNASDLTVHFTPSPRQHRVRLLYITARGSDGSFQAPRGTPCGPEAAARRIRTGAQLLQALTAELLAEAGLPRRTFQLVTEEDGVRPAVDRFECSLTEDKARALAGRELWPTLARELAAEFGEEMDHVKWLGFVAFTRYSCDHSPLPRSHEEVMERTRGHCALGGGGLALFGTGNFFAWAESLAEVPDCFGDCRRVDRRVLMDDSAFRGTFWSNYATGLGAVLHELGHTFDLSHTFEGIMQRGGDDINLALCYPPPGSPPCEQCSGAFTPSAAFRPPPDSNGALVAAWQPSARYLQKEMSFVPLRPVAVKVTVGGVNGHPPEIARAALLMPGSREEVGPIKKWGLCSSVFHNGRAAFARSSAVLLSFHRWFRDDQSSPDFCLRISRTELLADRGLRTVEFVADGSVREHWEFLGPQPPSVIPLGTSRLRKMCPDTSHLVVVAEDDEGHIYKARVRIDQFGESPVLSPC